MALPGLVSLSSAFFVQAPLEVVAKGLVGSCIFPGEAGALTTWPSDLLAQESQEKSWLERDRREQGPFREELWDVPLACTDSTT